MKEKEERRADLEKQHLLDTRENARNWKGIRVTLAQCLRGLAEEAYFTKLGKLRGGPGRIRGARGNV